MPANKKYLSTSPLTRISKILSGLLMGYVLASSFFLALAYVVPNYQAILISATWGIFILWVTFMILPYFFEKVWKVWAIYIGAELLLLLIIFLSK
jgi:hypothetical protein